MANYLGGTSDPTDFAMPGVRFFQYRKMREYVRWCADEMGLRDWTCEYFLMPPESMQAEGLEGAIRADVKREHFAIYLPPIWYAKAMGDDREQEAARQTVAHELLHCKFVELRQLVQHLETNLGDHAWGVFDSMWDDHEERFIDDLADMSPVCCPCQTFPASTFPRHRTPIQTLR